MLRKNMVQQWGSHLHVPEELNCPEFSWMKFTEDVHWNFSISKILRSHFHYVQLLAIYTHFISAMPKYSKLNITEAKNYQWFLFCSFHYTLKSKSRKLVCSFQSLNMYKLIFLLLHFENSIYQACWFKTTVKMQWKWTTVLKKYSTSRKMILCVGSRQSKEKENSAIFPCPLVTAHFHRWQLSDTC